VYHSPFSDIGVHLHSAFSQWGFVYLTNHGVDEKLILDFFDVSKQFFELDQNVKEEFKSVNTK
jgi:isopenicillin N synthase-like dioxygenase